MVDVARIQETLDEEAKKNPDLKAQMDNLESPTPYSLTSGIVGIGDTPAVGEAEVKTEPFNIPFTDIQFLGTGFATERKPKIDWTLTNPDTSITEILPFDKPEYKETFMGFAAVENAQGEELDLTGYSLEQRISAADRFGATKLINYVDGEREAYDIPWERAITQYTRFPDEIKMGPQRIDMKGMSYDEYRNLVIANSAISTLANPTPELGRAIHAQYLNEVLISNGVDARSRNLIIQQEVENMTVNQMGRLVNNSSETLVRGFGETALWAVGEMSDVIGSMVGVNMEGSVADYKTRQGVMDSWWKPATYRVQDYFAQQNVVIDLATAEDLVAAHTGFVPRALQLGAEFIGPSKFALGREAFSSTRELRSFNQWKKGKLEKDPELTDAALMSDWKEIRKTQYFGLGRLGNYEGRIVTALQIEDAALPVAQRAEVKQQVGYLNRLLQQRDGATDRLAKLRKDKDANEVDVSGAKQNLADIEASIREAQVGLIAVQRRSSVPKFIRDQNIQDTYMVAGAAAMGHLFSDPDSEIDSEFGELIGIGVGLSVYLAKGKALPALNALKTRYTGTQRDKMRFAARKITELDPGIQMAAQFQADKIGQFKEELIAAGVDPSVLDTSLAVVTDLVTIRHFADATLQRVSIGKALDPDTTTELQAMADINRRINAELNRILVDLPEGVDPEGDLVKTLQYFRKEAIRGYDELSGYIELAEKEAVGYFLNTVNGNAAAIADGSPLTNDPDKVLSFPEALDALHESNMTRLDNIPADNFASVINQHDTLVNDAIRTKATQIQSVTGNVDLARAGIDAAADANLPSNTTVGGLFSFQLENAHASAKAKATAPYQFLDNLATFTSTRGDQIPAGSLKVDIRDIFDSVFESGEDFLGLQRATGRNLKATDYAVLDKTLEEVSNPFFEAMAQKSDVTKEEFIAGLQEQFKEQGLTFTKGRNVQVQVAQYILSEEGLDAAPIFQVSPTQLREIQRSIGSLRYKYAGNNEASTALEGVDLLIENKFDQFTADGVPVGQLQVTAPDGNRMPLSEYMANANDNYRRYKANWYDTNENAIIPQLMSWGNRQKDDVTGSNPSGIRYNKLTSEWLNVGKLSDETYTARLIASLNRTLGEEVLVNGNMEKRLVIKPGTQAETLRATLHAGIGQYLHDAILKGKMTVDDINAFAQNVERNLKAVDAAGMEIPLVNVVDVIDEVLKPSANTYGKDLWNEATTSVTKKINSAVDDAIKPAKQTQAEMKHATDVLTRIYGEELNLESFGQKIANGSAADLRGLLDAMKTATKMDGKTPYSEADALAVLKNAYLAYAGKQVFKPTGRTFASTARTKEGADTLAVRPEFVEDVDAMRMVLGGNDPSRVEVAKILLGDDYDTWQAAYGFMAEALQNNPLARNSRVMMQGAPRSLSVESYISRLYAINRGVVRPQYVGTEATLQALRNKNFNFLQAVLTDPELGNMFVEMVRTGKPLSAKRNVKFESLLIQAYAQQSQVEGGIKEANIVDPASRTFTIHATNPDRIRMGYPEDYEGGLSLPSMNPFQTFP